MDPWIFWISIFELLVCLFECMVCLGVSLQSTYRYLVVLKLQEYTVTNPGYLLQTSKSGRSFLDGHLVKFVENAWYTAASYVKIKSVLI